MGRIIVKNLTKSLSVPLGLLFVISLVTLTNYAYAAWKNYTVTITKVGKGEGSVTINSQPGINWNGSTGTIIRPETSTIAFTAVPKQGSKVTGWQGCDQTTGNEGYSNCLINRLTGPRNITVTINIDPVNILRPNIRK